MAFQMIICFYLFFLSSSLSSSLNPPLCNSHDYFVLFQFKNSLSLNHSASRWCDEFYDEYYYSATIHFKNSSYPKTTSWGNDSNCCLWDGITCDSMSGHVIGLDLSCSWLQGQLHPNSTLFQLSHLQTLNLAFNNFSGSLIAPQFGELSTLTHINLSSSSFSGEIPLKIAKLSKLVSLDLSWNSFFLREGLSLRLEPSTWEKLVLNMTDLQELVLDSVNMSSIAPSSLSLLMNLSSSLVSLRLSDTELQGNITSDILYLENLQQLDLSENSNLNGQLPKFNSSSPLSFLDLGFTNFLGDVLPDSVGHLKYLNHLTLYSCNFEGRVPLGLSNLTQLTYLNLASNKFSGEISFLSNQEHLTHLYLDENNFFGEIPSKISQLSKLVSLDLSYNYGTEESSSLRLEPSIWEKLILNTTNLRVLRLSHVSMSSIVSNSLPLPMNVSSSLIHLSLKETSLQGDITNTILQLENLKYLDLGGNSNIKIQLPKLNWSSIRGLYLNGIHFFGEIPDSIGHLKSLEELDLSDCQFEGPIPPSFKSLTQLISLDLSSNKFSGGLSFLSTLTQLRSLDLSSNNFSSGLSFPSTLTQLTNLDLSSNNFSRGLSFPSTLTQLTNLDLSSNNFSSVPSFPSTHTQLISLDLSSNKISGGLSFLSTLTQLTDLDLSSNNFSSVPSFPSTLTQLKFLDLSSNKISGGLSFLSTLTRLTNLDLSSNNFSGGLSFPSTLTQLISLDLSFNKISGGLSFLSTFTQLINLDLSSNKFSGRLSFPSTLTQLISLDLSSNRFSGGIPSLLTLVNLTFLLLSNNSFSGQIPSSVSNFERLKILELSINNFSGEIPNVFGNLSALQYLGLNNNNFSGQVPPSLTNTSVTSLDLSFNMLHGNLPVPFFEARFFSVSNNKFSGDISFLFCNASSLEILNLSHNNLSGPIPQCLVGLPNLSILDLQMNVFSGTLPNKFSKNNVLHTLHFNSNQLNGSLPLSLARCILLEIFDVGRNKIRDTFPSWLDDLPELQVLVLRENRFYGAISTSNTKHPFPKLRIFDISNNHFNGFLPTTYIKEFKGMMKVDNVEAGSQYMGSKNYLSYMDSVMITWKGNTIELERILTIFTTIDLSINSFVGEIPKAIGELHVLIGLNLSHNRIIGSIPKSIGKLKNLEWLDLSCNKLVGEIPLAMTNLNFLSTLNLSQNQLEGMIPKGKQFNTFQNDSYEGNLGLCGAPLSKTCNTNKGESPTPSSSMFDSIDKFGFGWKPVALGYGCGMVFGILMGCIVFSIGKPQWLVKTFGGQSKKQGKWIRNRAHAN